MAAILRHIQPKLYTMSNGLFGNWTPDGAVSVGDYGVLKNGGFQRRGSLGDYGAQINAAPATGGSNELEYKDKINMSIDTTAGAAQGVKINLKMKGEGAFLYHLFDVHQIRPVNQRVFEEEVAKVLVSTSLELPDGAVLVTEVQHAAKATIIASDGSEGKLELATSLKPSGSFLSGGKGKVSLIASFGSIFSWIARNNTVTLLKLVRPKLPPSGGPGGPSGLQNALEWARNHFKVRQLSVPDLVIRTLDAPSDVMVVAIGDKELRLSFSALTLDELMETITDEVAPEMYGEPVELDISTQQFGKGYMTY